MKQERTITVSLREDVYVGCFSAMASPCEVLLETTNEQQAHALTQLVANEAWRIEDKYSRYKKTSVASNINEKAGSPVAVDAETAQLLNFAYHCYTLSNGLFDISAGVLRKAWNFKPQQTLPTHKDIAALLPLIGLLKCSWQAPLFCLQAGMEIDFGGLGKEYAVDNALAIIKAQAENVPALINFGGDIAASSRQNQKPWLVGIEATTNANTAQEVLAFKQGGIATSGDAKRRFIHNNKRYGHILNPKTGWPVEHAPQAITVAAETCTEAGVLSTLAMLQGIDAEAFLTHEKVRYWVQRK